MRHSDVLDPPEAPQRARLRERRREGRVEYQNPALIELLRQPAGSPQPGPGSRAGQLQPDSVPVDRDARSFSITDFANIRPRPRERSGTAQQPAQLDTPAADIAAASAARYCRNDYYAQQWAALVAREVAGIRDFITGRDYPSGPPSLSSTGALIARLVSLSRFVRHLCLVSGRDGTLLANQVVIEAIRSLARWDKVPGEYAYWSDLRLLCASLSFYWAVAGAIAHHDFKTVQAIMHARVERNGADDALVSALPLLALRSIDWQTVKGLELRKTPASDFLFGLFKPEIADAALDPGEAAEDLFDRVELLISLEFAHIRLHQIATGSRPMWFWVPLGRYVCNLAADALFARLAAYERLPADHALLDAGLLGGAPQTAAHAAQAIRQTLAGGPRYASQHPPLPDG